jgi:hypothetical protein
MYFRDMTFGRHGAIDSTMAFFVLLISYNLQHLIEARGGKMRLRDADNLQRLLDAKRGAMFKECSKKLCAFKSPRTASCGLPAELITGDDP